MFPACLQHSSYAQLQQRLGPPRTPLRTPQACQLPTPSNPYAARGSFLALIKTLIRKLFYVAVSEAHAVLSRALKKRIL